MEQERQSFTVPTYVEMVYQFMERLGIKKAPLIGHSMGGHGALTIALNHPDRFRSCSAFAPIVSPSTADWAKSAFTAYLGSDEVAWRAHDACALVEDGKHFDAFLIDQGEADIVIDARFLKNPHYDPDLRPLTGRYRAEVQHGDLGAGIAQAGLFSINAASVFWSACVWAGSDRKSDV